MTDQPTPPAPGTDDLRERLAAALHPFLFGADWSSADAADAVLAVVEPALAQRECGLCGGPMSRNPHPDAGKPEALVEVGALWQCIPCTVGSRHAWNERHNEARRVIAAVEALRNEWLDVGRHDRAAKRAADKLTAALTVRAASGDGTGEQ